MVEAYAYEAVVALARRLETCGALWVLGGSTGLGMRGARLAAIPRDIDIYADAADARMIHAHLQDWATDMPQVSITERYRSILSHYAVAGTVIELVGEFRIDAAGSHYETEVARILHPAGEICQAAEARIRLIPLGHELIFNALRERKDRCEMIGAFMKRQPDKHLPLLRTLLARNDLSVEIQRLVKQYAGMDERE